jgi:hypothetical protein
MTTENPLTAEAFLIAEYQRMKTENDKLREEVAQANAKAEEAITSKNGEGTRVARGHCGESREIGKREGIIIEEKLNE